MDDAFPSLELSLIEVLNLNPMELFGLLLLTATSTAVGMIAVVGAPARRLRPAVIKEGAASGRRSLRRMDNGHEDQKD
jgi:hypothetical protein